MNTYSIIFDLAFHAFENMPTGFQVAFQQNMLNRALDEQLSYVGVMRAAADKKPIPTRSGETFIYSKAGKLVPVVQAVDVSGYTLASDLSGTRAGVGTSNNSYTVEQYAVSIFDRDYGVDINIIQDEETLASLYAQNWVDLTDQAGNSLDQMGTQALAIAYEGGNSWVTAPATASSHIATILVDNIIGLDKVFQTVTIGGIATPYGAPVAVTGSLTLAATVYPASGAAAFAVTISATTTDSSNTSTMVSSGMINGKSGTLTVTGGGSTQAYAVGDVIVAFDAQTNIRPGGVRSRYALANNSTATLQLLINAKKELKRNGVKPFRDGSYLAVMDPSFGAQIYTDPQFQIASQGAIDSEIFRNAKVNKLAGLAWAESTNNPIYSFTNSAGATLYEHKCFVIGQGALLECTFEGMEEAYKRMANSAVSHVEIVRDVALITRPGIDSKGQIWSQTWTWIGGHTVPTDATVTSNVYPSATAARFKRAVCVSVADAS